MTYEENKSNNAKLKAEWLSHSREAVEGEWYQSEAAVLVTGGFYVAGEWFTAQTPQFDDKHEYRIVKTPNHPEYVAPPKMIKVEFEVSDKFAENLLESLKNYSRYYGLNGDKGVLDINAQIVVDAIKAALAKI